MDQQNASVTSSVAPSIVETAGRIVASEETNSGPKEKHSTLASDESTKEEMNVSNDSILTHPAAEFTDPGKDSTNDESKIARSTGQDGDSMSNKIEKIETVRPNESCKSPDRSLDRISTDSTPKEANIDTSTENSCISIKSEQSVNVDLSTNHRNERDEETIKMEMPDNREKSTDIIEERTSDFIESAMDSAHESEKEKVIDDRGIIADLTNLDETSKEIEKIETIERTEEIIELHVIEYENENKVTEMEDENAEVIEIVVRSRDEKNDSGDVTIEAKMSSPKEECAASAVNTESIESLMENKDKSSSESNTRVDTIEKISNEKIIVDVNDLMEDRKLTCPKVESTAETTDATSKKINDHSTSDSPIAQTSVSVAKQRSVIEDIFDDWQDDNPEEESSQTLSKSHDSVEMELKILLHDEKSVDEPCKDKIHQAADVVSGKSRKSEKSNISGVKLVANERKSLSETTEVTTIAVTSRETERGNKDDVNDGKTPSPNVETRKIDKTIDNPVNRERFARQKPLAPRPGVKVPGILLTSPIVSKSAVSKVLKERIREQQKEFDSPTKPDIFFVKKITQRLSHKLAAASAAAAQVPGLLPIQQIGKTSTSVVDTRKATSNVDKELLAILEGDVDPDWSNLKSPGNVDTAKSNATIIDRSSPAKLDPAIERELALKQLLELPSSPAKKNAAKKTTVKPTRVKIAKIVSTKTTTPKTPTTKIDEPEIAKSLVTTTSIDANVKEDSMDSTTSSQGKKSDETRSGRKRKPTEKAREHEISTKRQKVVKGKLVMANKRNGQEEEKEDHHLPSPGITTIVKADETSNNVVEISRDSNEKRKISTISDNAKKRGNDSTTEESDDDAIDDEVTRTNVPKKISVKPSAKRKVPIAQKLGKPKISTGKKSSISLKAKLAKAATKKGGTKIGKKHRNGESTGVEVKPKKKVNEIDRLLQDEGVVNLLYDVEQPDRKRLVPITKSQTKVMDLQKIQRELKIRTKLVKNAVLRLRTSSITTTKVSPRSKRTTSYSSDFSPDKRTNDQSRIERSSSPTDFIYPAKIRNAADASVIIRRHSSSSFSSSSASPRASIDGPERLSIDGSRNDETTSSSSSSHLLRSNKRRHSQDDDKKKKKRQTPEPRRNRRRTTDKSESDTEMAQTCNNSSKNKSQNLSETIVSSMVDDIPSPPKLSKKMDSKKIGKSTKQFDVIDVNENNSIGSGNAAKITTRSNGSTGTGGGKIMPKSKKSVKCKVTFAKGSDSVNKKMDSPRQQDELSACLAEAVTALSNDSGGPSRCRSTIPVNRNKTKGNSSIPAKICDIEENKQKTETRVQFSNNEINVQRHGYLVQLLLTPSTSKKIRNGITIQVMQEIRETLSILKKDEDCRVVLLTSTGTSFCEGLELSTLLHENKEERRLRAEELANGVKEFIKSLATFNKPIVAGVQGTAVGLGVTMLPWFDLVIASDKATFSTPYGKLGQIAEGAAIFTLSHILGSAVTSELLLGGRTLTANEALRAGLVSRVLWPDRFQAELIPSLRSMSEQSSQSMEATKALLRHSLRKKLDAALESECYLLVQHWCSAECQSAIMAYVDEKIQ